MRKHGIIMVVFLAIQVIISYTAKAQYTKLLDFNETNGSTPFGSLISDGTFLYGTTAEGGTKNHGTIFKIMPDGSGYVMLHDFLGGVSDGSRPRGTLYYDGTYLWGMTAVGGASGVGTIFRILPDGLGYQRIFSFTTLTSGKSPEDGFMSDGTYLYGMTTFGGIHDNGTIFKILLDGTGFTKLIDFEAATTGRWPYGTLISDGTFLYGLTNSGINPSYGTLFKILPSGQGFEIIHNFIGSNSVGYAPPGSLYYDGTFLYGVAASGGTNNNGTIFKIMPDGTNFETLFHFNGTASGGDPQGHLVSYGGYLYGMTKGGGTGSNGTIYRIKPDGSGFMKVFNFDGTSSGKTPVGSLVSVGNILYGMTRGGGTNDSGVIFSLGVTTGLQNYDQNARVTIFPNPAFDYFKLDIEEDFDGGITLKIFNGLGSLMSVETIQKNQQNINVSSLISGMYIVEISSREWTQIQRLMIQK